MKKFPEKRIVITGGGSGLGRTLALDFAKMGWKVAVSDIDEDRAEETARAVDSAGGTGLAVYGDVAKLEDVENLARTVTVEWGGADIIVNNAGVPVVGFVDKIPMEDWKWEIDINLLGVIHGCRTFLPIFRRQGGGHIVNIASSAGICSLAEMGPYNVTKAGVISLSETLKVELSGQNIGISVACPTFFKTNLMDQCRYTDDHQVNMANAFFAKSMYSAEDVSRHIIRSIEKNRLYVLTQMDARFFWRIKRLMPQTFFTITGWFYRKKYLDKALGIEPSIETAAPRDVSN